MLFDACPRFVNTCRPIAAHRCLQVRYPKFFGYVREVLGEEGFYKLIVDACGVSCSGGVKGWLACKKRS